MDSSFKDFSVKVYMWCILAYAADLEIFWFKLGLFTIRCTGEIDNVVNNLKALSWECFKALKFSWTWNDWVRH